MDGNLAMANHIVHANEHDFEDHALDGLCKIHKQISMKKVVFKANVTPVDGGANVTLSGQEGAISLSGVPADSFEDGKDYELTFTAVAADATADASAEGSQQAAQ